MEATKGKEKIEATKGKEKIEATNVEEKMWCGHCGVETPIRREGATGSVKSCNWCGKILADETGTAEEYNQLYLQYQALQEMVSIHKEEKQSIKKQ